MINTDKFHCLSKSSCMSGYLPRKSDGHKGTFGKVLIMAGSADYPGAGIMAANGALRSGVGIVTLALPECLKGSLPFTLSPEIILRYFPSKDGGFYLNELQAKELCDGYDAVLVGCGWGKSSSRLECLINIAKACEKLLVLDADALNLIAENKSFCVLDETRAKTIITPHFTEFSRLVYHEELNKDLNDRLKKSMDFASKHRTIVVQKSAKTIITDSITTFVNNLENSGLAKGGSGDLLAGLIAGIAASRQCKDFIDAANLGVYLHSQAGNIAKDLYSENGMTISDVSSCLPVAWKEFLA